jgi:hypothetical protein
MICGNDNEHIELVPGLYMLGPVTPDPVFAGDVNITLESLAKMDATLLACAAKCEPQPTAANPLPVEVFSTCAKPVMVELCTPIQAGIEIGFAPLGCIVTPEGVLKGKVFMCKEAPDVTGGTGAASFSMVMVDVDGVVTTGYTGPWQDCSVLESCVVEAPVGVVDTW